MNGFQCPYCQSIVPNTISTRSTYYCHFFQSDRNNSYNDKSMYNKEYLALNFYKCPMCDEISVGIIGLGSNYEGKVFYIRPTSKAKSFPDYIPEKIRQDYEEACAIVNLSPKSSATLSRRCMQSMISDYWNIHKNRLVDAINELKGKVPASQWEVIDALRSLGNIGAHPEADINTIIDINPDDASKLIAVIELLIEQWYIERHKQEELFNNVLKLKEDKNNQRKGKD